MAGAKMWGRRLMVLLGAVAFGSVASAVGYLAAGVAMSVGAAALGR